MKRTSSFFQTAQFDSHMHFGVMLSALFDDKLPYCQNLIGFTGNFKQRGRFNTGIVFPFPDDFIGNEVLPDSMQNAFVRTIFESIPYQQQNKRFAFGSGADCCWKTVAFLLISTKYKIKEQLQFLRDCVANHEVYGLNIILRQMMSR